MFFDKKQNAISKEIIFLSFNPNALIHKVLLVFMILEEINKGGMYSILVSERRSLSSVHERDNWATTTTTQCLGCTLFNSYVLTSFTQENVSPTVRFKKYCRLPACHRKKEKEKSKNEKRHAVEISLSFLKRLCMMLFICCCNLYYYCRDRKGKQIDIKILKEVCHY